jgi:hypothetical protein
VWYCVHIVGPVVGWNVGLEWKNGILDAGICPDFDSHLFSWILDCARAIEGPKDMLCEKRGSRLEPRSK